MDALSLCVNKVLFAQIVCIEVCAINNIGKEKQKIQINGK